MAANTFEYSLIIGVALSHNFPAVIGGRNSSLTGSAPPCDRCAISVG